MRQVLPLKVNLAASHSTEVFSKSNRCWPASIFLQKVIQLFPELLVLSVLYKCFLQFLQRRNKSFRNIHSPKIPKIAPFLHALTFLISSLIFEKLFFPGLLSTPDATSTAKGLNFLSTPTTFFGKKCCGCAKKI